MKSLIFALTFIFTTTASATTLAQLNKGIRLAEDSYKVIVATIDDDGTLNVALSELLAGQDIAEISQTSIHPRNLERIKDAVVTLANAKIVQTFSDIVCMIAVPLDQQTNHLLVSRDYDFQTGSFNGGLTFVHGPQGCWVTHHLALAEDYHNQVAMELKSIIEILAIEALGDSVK